MKREELTEREIEALEYYYEAFHFPGSIEDYDPTEDGFADLTEFVAYVENELMGEETAEIEHNFGSVYDNPYYNEQLDMDQQSIDFWNEI